MLTDLEICEIQQRIDHLLTNGQSSAWERQFLSDMQAKFARFGARTRLSDRQLSTLRRITGAGAVIPRQRKRDQQLTEEPQLPRRAKRDLFLVLDALPSFLAGIVAIALLGYYSGIFTSLSSMARGCDIKGNITLNGRIYHVPGQEYYKATRVNPFIGERWFCTEEEARAAGWRKART